MKILLCVTGYGRRADGSCKIPLPASWECFIKQVKEITRDTLGIEECDAQEIRMTYIDQDSDKCAITKWTYNTFKEDTSISKKSCKVNIQYSGDKSAVRLLPEVVTAPRRRRRPAPSHREWDIADSDTSHLPRGQDTFFTSVTENSSSHSYNTALQETVSPPQAGMFSDTSVSVASDYFGASSSLIESEYLSAYRKVAIEEKKSRRTLLLGFEHSAVIAALVEQEARARNSVEADSSVDRKQLSLQGLRARPPSAPHIPPLKPSPPRSYEAPNSAPAGRYTNRRTPHTVPIQPPTCGWLENPLQNDIQRTLRTESEIRHQILFLEDAAVSNLDTLHTRLWIQAALASSRRELEIEQLQVEALPGSWGSAGESTNDISSSGSSEERTTQQSEEVHPLPRVKEPAKRVRHSCLKTRKETTIREDQPTDWPQAHPLSSSPSIQPILQASMPFLLWPMLGALTDLSKMGNSAPSPTMLDSPKGRSSPTFRPT
eukprot:TRINITY_DN10331_c0_g1_i2.p1 TRINITY_DN10331_c0_g1~~TRINITY_DN10331_c0_g1_i2.p1  ORF type:complete len:488 (+),score=76.13 TRINITY_DN10331_c0_g1_i2:107-1570(+)